jgi:hypothetical protein
MSRSLSFKAQIKDPKDIAFNTFLGARNYLLSIEQERFPVKSLNLFDISDDSYLSTIAVPTAKDRADENSLERVNVSQILQEISKTFYELGYQEKVKALPWKPVEAFEVNFFKTKRQNEYAIVRRGGSKHDR